MTVIELSKQEAFDLVTGAKILANGGGGNEAKAIENINKTYSQGRFFTICDLSNLKESDHVCIVGMVGGGITKEEKKLVEKLEIVQKSPMITAVEELENNLGVKFKAFVATELGPNNSIIPLMTASLMEDKLAINGDCCGRSKPMISISTTTVAGISISPLSCINQYGDRIIVTSTVDDKRGEKIARSFAGISGGNIGVARCPMTIKQAKHAIIPRTLTLAITLGKAIREANITSKDPIKAIQKNLPDFFRVFQGSVKDFSRVEKGGFTSGEIILESKDLTKDILRIFYQNEYLLTWLNDKHYITCPDSIIIVDEKTGYGLTPWEDDFIEGRKVVVFARNAPKIWRKKNGLAVFGPQVFDESWSVYKKASSF